MATFDPVAMVLVPPATVVPDVGVVEIAIVAAPIGMILNPFGMMPIHPFAVVIMPPVGIAPFMMLVPVAPSARASGHPGSASDFVPDVGMVLKKCAQLGMLITETAVVDKVGIGGQMAPYVLVGV